MLSSIVLRVHCARDPDQGPGAVTDRSAQAPGSERGDRVLGDGINRRTLLQAGAGASLAALAGSAGPAQDILPALWTERNRLRAEALRLIHEAGSAMGCGHADLCSELEERGEDLLSRAEALEDEIIHRHPASTEDWRIQTALLVQRLELQGDSQELILARRIEAHLSRATG